MSLVLSAFSLLTWYPSCIQAVDSPSPTLLHFFRHGRFLAKDALPEMWLPLVAG